MSDAAIVQAERDSRRASLARIRDSGDTRTAKRAAVLLLDYDTFDLWKMEAGGDEGLMYIVCAQVASGASLKAVCGEYGVDYGLTWTWLSEDEERLERYYRAQRGVADALVSETTEIANGALPDAIEGGKPDVFRDKLRTETNFKKAAKYDRARFGERDAGIVLDMRDKRKPEEIVAEMRALAAANPGLAEWAGRVMEGKFSDVTDVADEPAQTP